MTSSSAKEEIIKTNIDNDSSSYDDYDEIESTHLLEEEFEDFNIQKEDQNNLISRQFALMPVIDTLISDPLYFILKKMCCKWTVKNPKKLSESKHIFSDQDVFFQPSFRGSEIICVCVPFDSDPQMVFEDVLYGKNNVNSGHLAFRKAWIFERMKTEKQKMKKLPSKIVCFRTQGMTGFQFQ